MGRYDLGDDFIAIRHENDLAFGGHTYIFAQAIFQDFESDGFHKPKVASGSSRCQARPLSEPETIRILVKDTDFFTRRQVLSISPATDIAATGLRQFIGL